MRIKKSFSEEWRDGGREGGKEMSVGASFICIEIVSDGELSVSMCFVAGKGLIAYFRLCRRQCAYVRRESVERDGEGGANGRKGQKAKPRVYLCMMRLLSLCSVRVAACVLVLAASLRDRGNSLPVRRVCTILYSL